MITKRQKANAHIISSFEKHIGHVLIFNHGDAKDLGRLKRVTVENENVILWVESGGPFDKKFFFDQAKECSCGEGKK